MNVLATCDGHRPLTDDIVVTVAVAYGWATDTGSREDRTRESR